MPNQPLKLSPDRLLSRSEVEDYFGISRRFLEVSAVRGDGPPFSRIGRSVKYQVDDLRHWIAARRVQNTSQEVSE